MNIGYRIYPLWFAEGDPHVPMRELAARTADHLGRHVEAVVVDHSGFDRRGWFMDFTVTYTSTVAVVLGASR